jgi:7-alpha-hydroxysteroid dehydrogenase
VILDRFRLDGRVAIVTGAGQGIGRGIALGLAEAGADVVVGARTQADLEEVVAGVEERGGRALAVVTDVLVDEDRRRLVDAAVERFGRLDILVNNAGGTGPRAAMATSERFFDMAMKFNVTSPFLMSQLAAQAMVDTAGRGAIVNISSRSSDMVLSSFVAYGAGKAALNQMTRNLASELAPVVRVNAIVVGGVATQGLEVVLTDDDLRAQFEANTPMGEAGSPEDVACAALYLASPASRWVTGKLLHVDGGCERPAIDVPAPPLTPSRRPGSAEARGQNR